MRCGVCRLQCLWSSCKFCELRLAVSKVELEDIHTRALARVHIYFDLMTIFFTFQGGEIGLNYSKRQQTVCVLSDVSKLIFPDLEDSLLTTGLACGVLDLASRWHLVSLPCIPLFLRSSVNWFIAFGYTQQKFKTCFNFYCTGVRGETRALQVSTVQRTVSPGRAHNKVRNVKLVSFYARSQDCVKRLSALSCLSGGMEKFRAYWTVFHEI